MPWITHPRQRYSADRRGAGAEVIKEIYRETRIDVLIISHSHPDHIRYWSMLGDRHILLPKETPDTAADLFLLGERFVGNPEEAVYWAGLVNALWGVEALRQPDDRYGNGDVIEIGGTRLEAIHAPGHVDDHYCFLERNTGTLLTTDIDLTSIGPWYGNVESDIDAFEKSVRSIMNLRCERVCSSHRRPIEGNASAEFRAYLEAFERHRRAVLDLCDPPVTLEQIADASPFYGNGLWDKVGRRMFETKMVAKNPALLIRDGLVEESGGLYAKVGT